MKKIGVILIIIFSMQGCQIFNKIALNTGLPSEQEIVDGLKKALEEGAKYAVKELSKKDGYYNNRSVKIILPPDLENVFDAAKNNQLVQNLGLDDKLQKKIDDFELAINRTAEQAATEALPIFGNAISNLTISQGIDILQGTDLSGQVSDFDSIAATHYLELQTRANLFALYKPKMDSLLNIDLGLGFSANQAWDNLTTYYNNFVAPVLRKQKINYSLSEYSTNKALDGLFYMMGAEEKEIRKNPYQYSFKIIKKVFGYAFKNQSSS
ncbi:MAG: DUF4197 domain-containing protein [Bacteroidales bacterium]|nr:DUF4197 domain-containing protein [Bacteroidales bacterium]